MASTNGLIASSIYLDSHTASRPCDGAIEKMVAAFHELSSDIESHIRPLYALIGGADDDVFIFTSSGAEAISQVIWSVFSQAARKEGKTQFITSAIEDAPTLQMLKRCEELGGAVKIAPITTDGRIDIAALAELITPRTALISVTMAQGLTGVIQPIEEICSLAKERDVLLHFDASYVVGNMDISFSGLSADYLTFSGDQIFSVKGSGALFAKKGKPLAPLILGGGEQKGLRGGKLDLPSLAAFGAAARLATLSRDSIGLEAPRLRNFLENELQARIDAKVLFHKSPRLPNTTALAFPRVHANALRYLLERKGLYPNEEGSYCQYLHRLLAHSGIDEETALSFSLSRMTTQADIVQAISMIAEAVKSLQAVSEALF